MTVTYELSELSHLDSILARETNINNLVSIRAQIEALRVYAVNIGKSKDECKTIAMARIKSERRAGQVLLSLPKYNGSRPDDVGLKHSTPQIKDTIGKSNSHRWQTIAQLPDKLFEELLLGCIQNSEMEITTNYFFKAAKIHLMRMRGISTDRPQQASQTISISSTDMVAAAQTIRTNLSAAQITQLIIELQNRSKHHE